MERLEGRIFHCGNSLRISLGSSLNRNEVEYSKARVKEGRRRGSRSRVIIIVGEGNIESFFHINEKNWGGGRERTQR